MSLMGMWGRDTVKTAAKLAVYALEIFKIFLKFNYFPDYTNLKESSIYLT